MTKKTSSNRSARTKTARKSASIVVGAKGQVARHEDSRFAEVISLIESARARAYQAVNAELVSLYWQLGNYISQKIASADKMCQGTLVGHVGGGQPRH